MSDDLARRLGHAFRRPELLDQALTHRSHGARHNERLEFVGDAVLNCVVARTLFERFPDLPEGDLSRVRANLELLITKSRATGAKVILVAIRVPTNYGKQYGDAFQQLYPDLAKSHGIPLVSFLADEVALREDLFLEDGIHPNAVAQPILLDSLWPKLAPLLRR